MDKQSQETRKPTKNAKNIKSTGGGSNRYDDCPSKSGDRKQNPGHGLFCDKQGNTSSKRVAAYILLGASLALIGIGVAFERDVANYLMYLFPTAGGLLGIGVLERK